VERDRETGRRIYQERLRRIGVHLDEVAAQSATIIESAAGFIVRCERFALHTTPVQEFIGRGDRRLTDLNESLHHILDRGGSFAHIPQGIVLSYDREDLDIDVAVFELTDSELTGVPAPALRGTGDVGHQAFAREGGYHDVLRLLGHELDRRIAYSILVTQAGDTLVASYQCYTAGSGTVTQKFTIVLDQVKRHRLRAQAVARRRRRIFAGRR
jgi:hypothetical protein